MKKLRRLKTMIDYKVVWLRTDQSCDKGEVEEQSTKQQELETKQQELEKKDWFFPF